MERETGRIVSRYREAAVDRGLLPRRELSDLVRLRPARAWAAVAGEWAGIALAIALFETLGLPWLYPLLVAWIGARMLGLWVLAHEGLHHLLLPDRGRNDLVTRLLLAWPVFVSLSEFRRLHLRHHRSLGEAEDPESELSRYDEFRFPKSRAELLAVLLLDVSGINAVRYALRRRVAGLRAVGGIGPSKLSVSRAKAAYYGAGALALTALGLWPEFLLYWLVPRATWFPMVLRLRLMAEHLHLPESEWFRTRTILPGPLERLFLAPHHVTYHVEHHLHPGVPCYALPRLHRRLRRDPAFAARAPVRRGYLRAFGEFVSD